jgi:fission process protein 1
VPFLPYVFDKPVEDAVEFVFHTGFKAFKGDRAVGETPRTGREHQLEVKPKEKEA